MQDTYVCGRHYLYSADSYWNLTAETAWFPSATRWDFADFGTFVILTNGDTTIIEDVATATKHFATALEIPTCRTLCNLNGQLVIGNTARGANWVEWSEIGYNYFTPGRSNVAGYRPLPTQGSVLQIKELRTGDEYAGRYKEKRLAIVYCTDGIFALTPYKEPAVTFGLDRLTDFGVASWVGGDDSQHVFVDEGGYLRRLSPKGIDRLGFQELFGPMLGEDIVVVHNPLEREWMIGGETRGFLLTEHGLCKTTQRVSGGVAIGESFVGCADTASTNVEITTDSIDLGIRANKLIETVELSGVGLSGVEVCGYWQDESGVYRQAPWFPVNKEGIASIRLNALNFRIGIRATSVASTFELEDEIRIRWKLVDKRAIRGMYGFAKASAGSDQ